MAHHNNKHSIELRGRRTSIRIEDEFWTAFRQIAADQNIGVASLVARVAEHDNRESLSSAVRLFVLRHFQHD